MNTCLGKSFSFGLSYVSSVSVYQFVRVFLSLLGFERGLWDLIV